MEFLYRIRLVQEYTVPISTQWMAYPEVKHAYSKPYNGFAKLLVKNEHGMDEKLIRVMAMKQEEDQKQEKADDFVKIYGSNKYGQTFKPTMLNLTGIKIYVARKGIAINENSLLVRILSNLFPFFKNLFLGNLYVEIYEGNPYSNNLLTYVKIEPDDISKEGSWIEIDLKGIIWASDLDEWNSCCSIVLRQNGGNEWNYYKWYYAYNDPYPNGSFYYYEGGRWKKDETKDFAFITYGKPTGNEPDGIEERWAVLVTGTHWSGGPVSVRIMKEVLISRGWDASKIWTINFNNEPRDKFWKAIEQMAENEDMDDICLILMSGHSGFISPGQLDKKLDELDFACKGMLIIVETCGSAYAIPYLAQEKRVIITSCKENEITIPVFFNRVYVGILCYFLADQTGINHKKLGFPPLDPIVGAKDGAFAITDPDTGSDYGGNNDGWISAEEAYEFAYKWITEFFRKNNFPPEKWAHPQFYDGYPGDLNIVKWRD